MFCMRRKQFFFLSDPDPSSIIEHWKIVWLDFDSTESSHAGNTHGRVLGCSEILREIAKLHGYNIRDEWEEKRQLTLVIDYCCRENRSYGFLISSFISFHFVLHHSSIESCERISFLIADRRRRIRVWKRRIKIRSHSWQKNCIFSSASNSHVVITFLWRLNVNFSFSA